MAITTYSTLKDAISSYAARSDTTFNNALDDFIDLAEFRLSYGSGEPGDPLYSPPLRVIGMEYQSDITISTQTASVPTGFLEAKRFYLSASPKIDLEYFPPDRFWQTALAADSTTGQPSIYTIEGSSGAAQFVFALSPGDTYTGKLLYYKALDPLSGSNTTNWLIANHPRTYLNACMLEYGIWEDDDKTAQKYLGLVRSDVTALNRQYKEMQTSGAYLQARPDAVA